MNEDFVTEHDQRHRLIRNYLQSSTGNTLEVARAIRPSLEAFLRVACPEHFPPETRLGTFRSLCEQRVGSSDEILNSETTQELRDIVEFANRFHHDTNPAWESEVINDGELQAFVRRTMNFIRP